MSKNQFRLALCQIRTETDRAATMEKAARMVAEAAKNGADIVMLPEMFNCPYAREYFKKFAALGHEETVKEMSRWAAENQVILVGGSVPECEGDKLYNTCFVFDRQGKQLARHRKIHLFDVDLPGMRFQESNSFAPGSDITVFDTEYGKMGAAVCFDVRFPELFRTMAEQGARCVFLPAQFNLVTGPRHWELLLRSRAVDYQVFVAGCSAARYEGFRYECWGHSTVTGPMGQVIGACDEKEQILYTDIDLTETERAKAQLPTRAALRPDLYPVAR